MQPRKGSIPRGRSGPGRAAPGRAGPRRRRVLRTRRSRSAPRRAAGPVPPVPPVPPGAARLGGAPLSPAALGSPRLGSVRYGWVRPGGGPAEPRLRPLQRRAAPLRSLPRPRGRRDGGGSGPPPSTTPLFASVSPSRSSRPRRSPSTALPGAARTTGGTTESSPGAQQWGRVTAGVSPPGAKFRGQRIRGGSGISRASRLINPHPLIDARW